MLRPTQAAFVRDSDPTLTLGSLVGRVQLQEDLELLVYEGTLETSVVLRRPGLHVKYGIEFFNFEEIRHAV